MMTMKDAACQAMLTEMPRYRADMTETVARIVVAACLAGATPVSETDADLWWSYQRHAERHGRDGPP